MQCGFHAYMESRRLAGQNLYYAKADEQGRFIMADVPPVTSTLAIRHPDIRTAIRQTVTVGPKQTSDTCLVRHSNGCCRRMIGAVLHGGIRVRPMRSCMGIHQPFTPIPVWPNR